MQLCICLSLYSLWLLLSYKFLFLFLFMFCFMTCFFLFLFQCPRRVFSSQAEACAGFGARFQREALCDLTWQLLRGCVQCYPCLFAVSQVHGLWFICSLYIYISGVNQGTERRLAAFNYCLARDTRVSAELLSGSARKHLAAQSSQSASHLHGQLTEFLSADPTRRGP